MSCQLHAVPNFGCTACILTDRDRWERSTIEAWRKTYKPPKCTECGAPMIVPDEPPYKFMGKLRMEVFCPTMNAEEGYFECDTAFFVEVA